MKQFVALLAVVLMTCTSSRAQNFLEHLQKNEVGKGVVTVKQSKEIDELVNGSIKKKTASTTENDKVRTTESTKSATEKKVPTVEKKNKNVSQEHSSRTEVEHKSTETTKKINSSESENDKKRTEPDENEEETTAPAVDLSKKIMRQSYRVTGYRVQLFAGGNSRNDRQKAESIGTSIKMKFPDEPVYVHFYSPRWTCRMGNYRSYSEAKKILNEVKSLGYKQTTIVKGKITVQY